MKRDTVRQAWCTSCGDLFEARRTGHGWQKTCSVECRVAALDRLILVLRRQRDELEAQLEDAS